MADYIGWIPGNNIDVKRIIILIIYFTKFKLIEIPKQILCIMCNQLIIKWLTCLTQCWLTDALTCL